MKDFNGRPVSKNQIKNMKQFIDSLPEQRSPKEQYGVINSRFKISKGREYEYSSDDERK